MEAVACQAVSDHAGVQDDAAPCHPRLSQGGGGRECVRWTIRKGFAVTSANTARTALDAAAQTSFAYTVIDIEIERRRACDDHGLTLVRQLRERDASMRIVVTTDHDSFVSVILALRAGADDLLPNPVSDIQLAKALLADRPSLPPIPETPLCSERVCWEHIQRVFEQCDRNVTEAARRLRMHRRSLQRILSKRAPSARGLLRS
jgi:two-component system response regulator RegA